MECIIDIESISSQNVQHYLRALEQDIWDSAEPIKVKEQNYRKIDWDKTVAYDVNSSRLIAIDYNGYAYEYRR